LKKHLNTKGHALRHAIAIGLLALFLAGLTSFISETVVNQINVIFVAFILLFVVILVGIIFDIIGVAATAAHEEQLHARSVNNVFGAAQAVRLVRNVHQTASFCNDVIGDVCGVLSGAIGVTIVFKILKNHSPSFLLADTIIMTAIIAALAVGGKAFGKVFAINNGTLIILWIGQLLAWLENFLHLKFFSNKRKRNTTNSKRMHKKRK